MEEDKGSLSWRLTMRLDGGWRALRNGGGGMFGGCARRGERLPPCGPGNDGSRRHQVRIRAPPACRRRWMKAAPGLIGGRGGYRGVERGLLSDGWSVGTVQAEMESPQEPNRRGSPLVAVVLKGLDARRMTAGARGGAATISDGTGPTYGARRELSGD
ncbi:putative formin-like protein 5 [Iris pallida]|uniref:Formin-like protein 5 n=1 Tax=Iris pallida TaxID=29817 RepID=A0AAX6GTH2_IRIPA|nr:putative formin-like protein 5 [Iris pallida]